MVKERSKDENGNVIGHTRILVYSTATAEISHLEFSDEKDKIKPVTVDELFTFSK